MSLLDHSPRSFNLLQLYTFSFHREYPDNYLANGYGLAVRSDYLHHDGWKACCTHSLTVNIDQFLDLFEGVGKIVGQRYTITLRENALPVAVGTACRVAYTLNRERLKRN